MTEMSTEPGRSTDATALTLKSQTSKQLAFTLPLSPDARIHLHVTNHSKSLVLFVASTSIDSSAGSASVGSLIYALPNFASPGAQPLSTALYTRTSSQDFMARLAKILAKRLMKPVYVGGEIRFWTAEDEATALRSTVEVVMTVLSNQNV